MGYSSDVRMVIKGPREVILREFASLRLSGDKTMQDALDEWLVMKAEAIILQDRSTLESAVGILGQGGVSWKWISGYPDVQAHRYIWDHFNELHTGAEDGSEPEAYLCGSFVRIGENDDDIESENFGDDPYGLAHAVRTIESDYDATDEPDLRPRLTASGA